LLFVIEISPLNLYFFGFENNIGSFLIFKMAMHLILHQ